MPGTRAPVTYVWKYNPIYNLVETTLNFDWTLFNATRHKKHDYLYTFAVNKPSLVLYLARAFIQSDLTR